MTTVHTPGPWEARPRGIGAGYGVYTVGARPSAGAICRIAGSEVKPAEANARLVAAAPELLATLKVLAAWIDGCDWSGCNESTAGGVREDLETARAVIAKAEGIGEPACLPASDGVAKNAHGAQLPFR